MYEDSFRKSFGGASGHTPSKERKRLCASSAPGVGTSLELPERRLIPCRQGGMNATQLDLGNARNLRQGPRKAREQEAVLRKLLDLSVAGVSQGPQEGGRGDSHCAFAPEEQLAGETPPIMNISSVEGTSGEPWANGNLANQRLA